jgi:phasin
MANDPFNSFEVPTQMRQLAEQSLEQARKAVDGFLNQAQKAVTTAEAQAAATQSSAKDMGQKAMGFAEQNIANSFEFAQKLVRAKDIQEVMALQQEYLQSQMKAMSAQAKDLGSTATKAAMDAAKPKT